MGESSSTLLALIDSVRHALDGRQPFWRMAGGRLRRRPANVGDSLVSGMPPTASQRNGQVHRRLGLLLAQQPRRRVLLDRRVSAAAGRAESSAVHRQFACPHVNLGTDAPYHRPGKLRPLPFGAVLERESAQQRHRLRDDLDHLQILNYRKQQ